MGTAPPPHNDEFLEFIARQMRSIHHWLGRYLPEPEDRKDVLQNTLIAAWFASKNLTPDTPIVAWLHQIAKHQLSNWMRREKRKGPLHPSRVKLDEECIAALQEGEEFIEVVNMDLSRLLSILPLETQKLILQIHLEGYSYGEIAEQQGCTVSSIKMKVHRGMEKMKKVARGDI
ncbi:MAG: sigma-70 family RNA polymerase sigma factor [Chlorobi bacterium]|nr:sigma-70 family RNA polymerase sigma factor [Chlorobiota bacterium]